jgi:bacterioferritin-associated ferredoxin
VQQLASKLPQNLTSLSLGFSLCKQITDASVQQLASKMPQNLTSLSLSFNGCRQITDTSVQQLASDISSSASSKIRVCFVLNGDLHLR